jgi:GT2 family glycosyltransferase
MKLAIGFITYNDSSAPYLPHFLPSLQGALSFLNPEDYEVLVYDNSSADNHVNKRLIDDYRFKNSDFSLSYFSGGQNLGFAGAYNILIAKAVEMAAEYFLVINPDTLLNSAAIKKMLAALENDGALASVAPKLLSWDFKNLRQTKRIDSLGIILKPGLKFVDALAGEEDEDNTNCQKYLNLKIIGPSGAAALFRLGSLEKISEWRSKRKQYFDERFFMYKEDCDLAYRLFLAGYKSRLVSDAIIYHDRSAASTGEGIRKTIANRGTKNHQVRSWSFTNQHLLFVKYWPWQNSPTKIIIFWRVFSYFIFALIFEQFLLKEYLKIGRFQWRK